MRGMTNWLRFSNPMAAQRRFPNPEQHQALCDNADALAKYLKLDVDPYDFGYHIPEWLGTDEEKEVEELSESDLKKFSTWILKHKLADIMHNADATTPAYLFFDSVKRLPAGSWLVHFSRSRFSSFEQGTTLDGLALSTWKKKKDTANCRTNLTLDIGLFEVVWGFALDAQRRNEDWSRTASTYGSNVVLFQTDCGVSAWHNGDEQYQAIFPLCSEYNVHSGSFDDGFVFDEQTYDSPIDAAESL